MSWDTADTAVLAEGKRLLIAAPTRFDGVSVLGVDEPMWRHTRRCEKYATIDHRPQPGARGQVPGEVAGHSRGTIQTGLQDLARPARSDRGRGDWRGFTGFKTATGEELPDAVTVMDPFHVIARLVMPWIVAVVGSSKTSTATTGTQLIRCTRPVAPCTPARNC